MASVTRAAKAAATFVTTLPSSPTDGQEVFYQSTTAGTGGGATNSMADVGAVWHLRYRSASASAYKWEAVGAPLIAVDSLGEVNGATLTALTWSDLSTAIKITAPLAGDYFVQAQACLYFGTADTAFIGIKVGTTEPTQTTNTASVIKNAAQYDQLSLGRSITAAASDVISLRFRSNLTQSVSAYRQGAGFSITPIRVG